MDRQAQGSRAHGGVTHLGGGSDQQRPVVHHFGHTVLGARDRQVRTSNPPHALGLPPTPTPQPLPHPPPPPPTPTPHHHTPHCASLLPRQAQAHRRRIAPSPSANKHEHIQPPPHKQARYPPPSRTEHAFKHASTHQRHGTQGGGRSAARWPWGQWTGDARRGRARHLALHVEVLLAAGGHSAPHHVGRSSQRGIHVPLYDAAGRRRKPGRQLVENGVGGDGFLQWRKGAVAVAGQWGRHDAGRTGAGNEIGNVASGVPGEGAEARGERGWLQACVSGARVGGRENN